MMSKVARWLVGVSVAWGLVSTATGQTSAATFHSHRLPHPERSIRVGFWFGMSNNELLTPEMVEWIGQRASLVILNGTEKGIDPFFDYTNVVSRFREEFPELPVLLYDWLQQDYHTGPGGRVGGISYEFLKGKAEWQLRTPGGEPIPGRTLHMDVTNPEYRAYHVKHVTGNVNRFGTAGVAFDTTLASLARPSRDPAGMFLNGAELGRRWTAASGSLLGEVKRSLGNDRIVLFNGLFNNNGGWPNRLTQQAQLLPHVDAAAVEFFGRNVHAPEGKVHEIADFGEFVWDYVELLPRHADTIIPVFGRSPRYVYMDYEEDYRIQRYCLVGYLLAMTPLSTFKYHSHFQTNYYPPGRTYGISYYADYDLDLGAPLGPASRHGGICQRSFEKAVVAIAPLHGRGGEVQLNRPCYTPAGEPRDGTVRLEPGTAGVFLFSKPPPSPERVVVDDFEDGAPGMWRQAVRDDKVTVVADPEGGRFLRVQTSPDPLYPYHERRVQAIRSLTLHDRLSFRIRTDDSTAAVLVRVEVDDSRPAAPVWTELHSSRSQRAPFRQEQRTPYAVLVLRPDDGSFTHKSMDRDIPYGQVRAGRAPYHSCPKATYTADGRWHTVSVDTAAAFAAVAPHLAPRRIAEMRLIGEADLDDIVLSRSTSGDVARAQTPIPPRAGDLPPLDDHELSSGVIFHERFDRAEPVDRFSKQNTTPLTGTDETGWVVTVGANEHTEFSLSDGSQGSRALRLQTLGPSGGEHDLLATCPLRRPLSSGGRTTLVLELQFMIHQAHDGGPNPWNKLWYVGLRSAATGLGYAVGLDLQANQDSPDNRLLRVDVFDPTSTPTVDDLHPKPSGFWMGPRASPELVNVPLRARISFTPVEDGTSTLVAWELQNTLNGTLQKGQTTSDCRLPDSSLLDTVRVVPNRWADASLHSIRIEAIPR